MLPPVSWTLLTDSIFFLSRAAVVAEAFGLFFFLTLNESVILGPSFGSSAVRLRPTPLYLTSFSFLLVDRWSKPAAGSLFFSFKFLRST